MPELQASREEMGRIHSSLCPGLGQSSPKSQASPTLDKTQLARNSSSLEGLDTSLDDDDLVLSDTDSLFDEPPPAARLTAPPIPGLYFDPTLLLPPGLCDAVLAQCMHTYFRAPDVNQVMLFGRASFPASGLPPILHTLLSEVSVLLRPVLPAETRELLFGSKGARQAIVNVYRPGEGISPHVDLLQRFGDGIVGVSLGSGCAMQFARAGAGPGSDDQSAAEYDVYLPPRSVLVLGGEARYDWTHGIAGRQRDFVQGEDDSEGRWIERGTRMSVTYRWLLPGADVVGDPES